MEQNRCPGCMNIKSGGAVCEHCGYDERKGNAPHQLQTGMVLLGKYLIGRVLGQGGFGITYLGWNRYLDTPVAIKEYYPDSFVERNAAYDTTVVCKTERMEEYYTENRMRFLREAKTLARLQSVPQIVSIHDFFEMNNTAYIVMEYLRGDDLRSLVRKRGGRLSAAETLNIMRPVMAALAKVHEAGLVHRDISPDNIMLQYDGSVKLMDFGAVRSVNNPSVNKELTQATQAIVKHGFAPMEQYSSKGSIGPWTDEYALCATMFYCMTGKVPENAPDRIMDESELDWDGIAGLTDKQKKILKVGTAVKAKDRFPNMRALMTVLYGQQMPQEPPVQEKPPQIKPEEQPKSRALEPGWKVTAHYKYYVDQNRGMVTGWQEIDGEKYYFDDFCRMVTHWKKIGSKKYYFGKDGKMATGWKKIGSWYYFGEDGTMATGWQTIENNRHFFDGDGVMLTGWQEIDGNKYYFDQYGKAVTGWKENHGNKNYFDANGKMATGWQTIDGNRYYFNERGVAVTGLKEIDGRKYFFGWDGKAVTGWQTIDGIKYYFDQRGEAVTGLREIDGSRYYFDRDGRPMTGWQELNGKKYYVDRTGKLAVGWKMIGSWYYFDPDGALAAGWRKIDGEKYYFGEGGAMTVGWGDIGGDTYYFTNLGIMAKGQQTIDGNRYDFGTDGKLVK